MGRQFPGSWLPFGQEQVIRCAEPHFRLVSSISGRLDYIETINRWNALIKARSFRKTLLKLQLLPRWLTSADFRLAFTSGVTPTRSASSVNCSSTTASCLNTESKAERQPRPYLTQRRGCGRHEPRLS